MKRKCEACPTWTQIVCRHAFGKFWDVRSKGGEGCDHPLDAVAEAWRKAGWKPEAKARETQLKMPTMPRRPTRPKVSAEIMRQADLFFGRAGK